MSLCPHISPQENIEESNDVYGLYADLMNVQDYEKDSQEKLYERLNHSDPELVHFHLNTLDRRQVIITFAFILSIIFLFFFKDKNDDPQHSLKYE